MKQSIFIEILTRLKNESPSLFKKLQVLFFSLAGIVSVLIFIKPLGLNLHGYEAYINWNTVVVLLGFGGVNMLPVADNAALGKSETEETSVGGGTVGTRKRGQ